MTLIIIIKLSDLNDWSIIINGYTLNFSVHFFLKNRHRFMVYTKGIRKDFLYKTIEQKVYLHYLWWGVVCKVQCGTSYEWSRQSWSTSLYSHWRPFLIPKSFILFNNFCLIWLFFSRKKLSSQASINDTA